MYNFIFVKRWSWPSVTVVSRMKSWAWNSSRNWCWSTSKWCHLVALKTRSYALFRYVVQNSSESLQLNIYSFIIAVHQDRLLKKLGANAYAFTFTLPTTAPASIVLQEGGRAGDTAPPVGVEYDFLTFVGENENDRSHKRSSVSMAIRKVRTSSFLQTPSPPTIENKISNIH